MAQKASQLWRASLDSVFRLTLGGDSEGFSRKNMLKRGMFTSAFGDVLDVFGRGGDGELSHF